jgi:hypothetical protein
MYFLITSSEHPHSPSRRRFAQLFQSMEHNPAAHGCVDPSSTYYRGEHPRWKKPLGNSILIVDIDTHAPTGENEIFNSERIDWEALNERDTDLMPSSILNHYLYATIHGYDYKFYHVRDMKDHFRTWIKPYVIRELLPNYQLIVVMDADVVVSHLELSLEWMFNRWGIQEETSMALP